MDHDNGGEGGTRLETTQWPERLWFNDGLLLDCTSLGFRLGQIDLLGHANTERELDHRTPGGVIHGWARSPGRVLIAPHESPPSEVNQTPLDINGKLGEPKYRPTHFIVLL